MVIDCHYHLEERLLKKGELLRRMDAAGVDRTALMACMCEPFPEPARPLIHLLTALLADRRLRPLGRALSANFTTSGDVRILGRTYRIAPDPDNAPVFAAAAENPDRLMAWIFVNPRGTNPITAEYDRWKDAAGAVGVKAHPFWHHFSPGELTPLAERLAADGKPLLIHAGWGPEGDLLALLEKVPGIRLILAHAGFPGYGDTWRLIRNWKNVCVDLSQTSYVGEKAVREAVAYLGAERCLYGTDGPYGFRGPDGTFDYGFIKHRIEKLFPDPGVRRRLLGENFAELAGMA